MHFIVLNFLWHNDKNLISSGSQEESAELDFYYSLLRCGVDQTELESVADVREDENCRRDLKLSLN